MSAGRLNFLVLLKMTGGSKSTAVAIRQRLVQVDQACKFVWFDNQAVGALLSTSVRAADIKEALLPKASAEEDYVEDLLILEVGSDWWARHESVADAWLGSRRRSSS